MGKKKEKKVKICFAASSGGHYEQLMMLKPLMDKYDSFVITEKTKYSAEAKGEKTYYMEQVNRREKTFAWKMVENLFKAILERKAGCCDLYRSSGNDSDVFACKIEWEEVNIYRVICKSYISDKDRKTSL